MSKLTRRDAFVATGAVAVAAAFAAPFAQTGQANAAELSADEAANLKVAKSYFTEFARPGADSAKVVTDHMAEDVVVRYTETTPPVMGRQKLADSLAGFTKDGRQYEIKILDFYAKGPVVVIHREDVTTHKGVKGKPTYVVAVMVVHDGRIKEWTDFILPKA